MRRLPVALLAVAASLACAKDAPTPPPTPFQQPEHVTENNNPGQTQQEHVIPDPHPVDVGLGDEVVTPVREEPRIEPPARSRRRMDLDQLNASLRRATGGIGWTETRNGNEVDLFVELSATLGKPDYVENTIEDLEPSALFLKFLDDAARSSCNKLITRELGSTDEETGRTFFVHAGPTDTPTNAADRVDANLRALLLRFHGRNVAAGSPDLQPWKWLMQSTVHVNGDPVNAWRAVCIGLINHPDFYTY